MRKFLLFLAFCAASATQIAPAQMHEWLMDANLSCQKFHFDTSKHPEFRAYILLADGKKLVFSSVKAMFAYFYENGKDYGGTGVGELLVTDFFSGEVFSASEAFYVFGSRIVSFKGDDLIPFRQLADAQEFESKFSGHRILKFQDITKKLIDYLR